MASGDGANIEETSLDGFVKSPFSPIFVIPAKAGIQLIQRVLDSCFRRSDGFSDFLRDHQPWERFCCWPGARPVRAGSIGRDTPGHGELIEHPPKKVGGPSPRPIHGETGALWFQADWSGSRAMGALGIYTEPFLRVSEMLS